MPWVNIKSEMESAQTWSHCGNVIELSQDLFKCEKLCLAAIRLCLRVSVVYCFVIQNLPTLQHYVDLLDFAEE